VSVDAAARFDGSVGDKLFYQRCSIRRRFAALWLPAALALAACPSRTALIILLTAARCSGETLRRQVNYSIIQHSPWRDGRGGMRRLNR